MSRRPRPHLPGSTFHLTTRLHRAEKLFTEELRTAIVGIIRNQVVFSDVDLLAYAIMPNHLHLVVRQGRQPLHRFMQPIIHRAALLVQRVHVREGHVFERRYRDRACADPEHLRNAIVYTHLNPVRAGLCADVGAYAWTSHLAWLGDANACDARKDPTAVSQGRPLFASATGRSTSQLVDDYLAFLRWRIDFDERRARTEQGDGRVDAGDLKPPPCSAGDAHWLDCMTPRRFEVPPQLSHPDIAGSPGAARPDMTHIAHRAMIDVAPDLDLAMLRSRWGGPRYVRARHAFIRAAAAAGYKGVQIAAYLHVTTTAVSKVLAAERQRLLQTAA